MPLRTAVAMFALAAGAACSGQPPSASTAPNLNLYLVTENPGQQSCGFPDPADPALTLHVELPPALESVRIAEAYQVLTPDGWAVHITMAPPFDAGFHELTKSNVGRRIAMVVDGELRCAPFVSAPISGGKVTISIDDQAGSEELVRSLTSP